MVCRGSCGALSTVASARQMCCRHCGSRDRITGRQSLAQREGSCKGGNYETVRVSRLGDRLHEQAVALQHEVPPVLTSTETKDTHQNKLPEHCYIDRKHKCWGLPRRARAQTAHFTAQNGHIGTLEAAHQSAGA